MSVAPARKLLSSMCPPVAVREAGKTLNIQQSSRSLPVEVPKTVFTPMAPRKTAGRKRRGRKGRGRHLTKTRRRHRK